jgi:hypothetical protein
MTFATGAFLKASSIPVWKQRQARQRRPRRRPSWSSSIVIAGGQRCSLIAARLKGTSSNTAKTWQHVPVQILTPS